MPVTKAMQGLPLGDCVGIVTHHSGFSVATFGEVLEKTLCPSVPVIDSVVAPAQTAGILVVNITLPSTDTAGNALAQSEIVKVRMHHNVNPGVDIFDNYVDFPPGEMLQWGPGDLVAHYIAVRVQDSHDNWSALSNEESGTANEAASPEPEDAGLWAHRLGVDAVWTEASPNPDSIAWSGVILYWKDNKYTITNGNTDKKYIWWDYSLSTTTFQTSDTAPTLTFEDVVVAYNDHGKVYLAMYSPMVIADFFRAGIMQSANWAEAVGSQFDLDAGTIKLGGSSDPKFSVDTDGLMTSKAGVIAGFTISAAEGLYAGSGATRVQMKPGVGFWAGATACGDATFYVNVDGSFYLGGAAGNLQWTPSPASLVVTATYASAVAGNERIVINDTVAHLGAIDASDNVRVDFHSEDITLFDVTPTLIAFIPTTTGITRATNPYFVHNQVTIDKKLVVGSVAINNPSEALHVTGDQKITGSLDIETRLNVDGYAAVGDHTSPTNARVVGIVYGTGSPPAANTTPIGTLWVRYTA